MEAARKSKGFMKGRLGMPLYRAPKPASHTAQYSSKSSANNSATATVGFIVNHDYVTSPLKPRVVIAPPESGSYTKFESFYGMAADESVDLKAATYISSVQERFKLERVNSERKNLQDACAH